MNELRWEPINYYFSRHDFAITKENHDEFNDGIDDVMDGYLKVIRNGEIGSESWDLRRMIFERFNSLIEIEVGEPDFLNWVEMQSFNTKLGRNELSFLHDTLKFIQCGRRPISIVSRISIIENNKDENKIKEDLFINNKLRKDIRDVINLIDKDDELEDHLLYYWVNREGGFTDFIRTCQVLFGSK